MEIHLKRNQMFLDKDAAFDDQTPRLLNRRSSLSLNGTPQHSDRLKRPDPLTSRWSTSFSPTRIVTPRVTCLPSRISSEHVACPAAATSSRVDYVTANPKPQGEASVATTSVAHQLQPPSSTPSHPPPRTPISRDIWLFVLVLPTRINHVVKVTTPWFHSLHSY